MDFPHSWGTIAVILWVKKIFLIGTCISLYNRDQQCSAGGYQNIYHEVPRNPKSDTILEFSTDISVISSNILLTFMRFQQFRGRVLGPQEVVDACYTGIKLRIWELPGAYRFCSLSNSNQDWRVPFALHHPFSNCSLRCRQCMTED